MRINSSSPPLDSPTPSNYLPRLAALLLSLALGGALLLWLIAGKGFVPWELERLSASGAMTIKAPLPLAEGIRRYLISDERGLIQQHRLSNPERAHLRTVKGLLEQLQLAVALLLLVTVLLLLVARSRQSIAATLRWCSIFTLAIPLLCSLLLLSVGFGQLFVWFHQLLFSEPDWVFASDATLTALYPPQLFLHGMIACLLMMVSAALPFALAARRVTMAAQQP